MDRKASHKRRAFTNRAQIIHLFPDTRYSSLKIAALLFGLLSSLGSGVYAQQAPFEVSNPKHTKWSSEEASKIYFSACELVARTIRPEKPPSLHPRFLLVLGGNSNEIVRTNTTVEVHLKAWDADKFAEAIVLVAAREILHADDVSKIAHQSVSFAQSSISVDHLRAGQ